LPQSNQFSTSGVLAFYGLAKSGQSVPEVGPEESFDTATPRYPLSFTTTKKNEFNGILLYGVHQIADIRGCVGKNSHSAAYPTANAYPAPFPDFEHETNCHTEKNMRAEFFSFNPDDILSRH
jgi:hypothetical protein